MVHLSISNENYFLYFSPAITRFFFYLKCNDTKKEHF